MDGNGDFQPFSSWRFQPIWKILVKIGSFPQVGVKIKNVWNHHLATYNWWLFLPSFLCNDLETIIRLKRCHFKVDGHQSSRNPTCLLVFFRWAQGDSWLLIMRPALPAEWLFVPPPSQLWNSWNWRAFFPWLHRHFLPQKEMNHLPTIHFQGVELIISGGTGFVFLCFLSFWGSPRRLKQWENPWSFVTSLKANHDNGKNNHEWRCIWNSFSS